MTLWIERMKAPRTFSYQWHPFSIEPGKDYSAEPKTMVEFPLESVNGGTRLIVGEAGFKALPADRIQPSGRTDVRGCAVQDDIKAYVEG